MINKASDFEQFMRGANEMYEALRENAKENENALAEQNNSSSVSESGNPKEPFLPAKQTSVQLGQKLKNCQTEEENKLPDTAPIIKKRGRKPNPEGKRGKGKHHAINLDPDLYVFLKEIIYFTLPSNFAERTTKTTYLEALVQAEMGGESIIKDYRVNLDEKGNPIVKRNDAGSSISIRVSEQMNEHICMQAHLHRITVTQYINALLRADMQRFVSKIREHDMKELTDWQRDIIKEIFLAIEQAGIEQ